MAYGLVYIGATIQLLGILVYIKDIASGQTKPNKVSWLMWSIAPLIGAYASFMDGAGLAALPVFMAGFGPLLVLIVSFFNARSYWKLGKLDYLCGICSFLAMMLWAITKEPLIAIIFAILSDAFAGIPTIIKSWKHPKSEHVAPYTTGLFGACTSFLVITQWDLTSYLFPAYLLLINSSIIIAMYKSRFISSI